jgi:isopenicillin N synthase-like dioxygenase
VDSIPVIDMGRLDRGASLAAIDRACREWGFFQIVGHDIDPALLDALFAVARGFFAQPSETKRRILRDADNPWGYFDQELTKRRQDWKEVFDFGPADGERLQPRWPTGALRAPFERTLRAYYGQCEALALQLLAAITTNLGVPFVPIATAFGRGHTSFLRLNHYPPRPQPPPDREAAGAGTLGVGEQTDAGALGVGEHTDAGALGVGEHTDAGALTVLLQDDQPGLEVRRDGRWHLVEPVAGALVINIGDIVQVWSNDSYRAALHRVITNPKHDRYSVPFFLNPSYETSYEPLSTTVTSGQPARYRPISWREFRTLRAAGDYADLGEEIQIAHYRR